MVFRCLRLLLPALAIAAWAAAPAHAQIYTVTDLGAVANPGSSFGQAVNDAGQVTGYSTVGLPADSAGDAVTHAFFWTPATQKMIDLGTLGGNSTGASINANAQIVGTYNDISSSDTHSFLWPGAPFRIQPLASLVDFAALTTYPINPLNSPSDVSNSSYAASISNAGVIAGYSDTLTYFTFTDPTSMMEESIFVGGPQHACVWQPGSLYPYDLDSLIIDPDTGEDTGTSSASGINNYGQVVGSTDTYLTNSDGSTISHACVWDLDASSLPIDIDNVSSGSVATSISDVAHVTGYRISNGFFRACVWSPDGVQDLDPSGTFGFSIGESINNNGQVVGLYFPSLLNFSLHPFLWSPGTGQMKDLNTLIDPKSGWTLIYASSISNTGYITGLGVNKAGFTHGLLLKPVLWGARVLLKRTNPTQTINDHLVSFENGQVTLLSGLSFNTTGQITADENAKIPADDIISIQVLSDHPDTQNPADIPGEAGFNKYLITPGVGKGTPTAKYSAKNVIELGQLVGDSIPSPNIGFNNGNWNTIFYQYPGHYSRYPKPFSKDDGYSFYAIPRVPGATNYQNIYNYLTDAASSLSLSALGIQKNRAMPRQVLYGIAWQESPDAYNSLNPTANGKGWNQFGWVTRYKNNSAVYDHDSNYGSTNYTMVTVDGGIGIMQITGGIAFDLAAKAPMPDGLDALSGQLTVLYGISGDPAYNIQAGAYTLDGTWATAPSLFRDDAASEFLDHWYYAVGSYNGSGQTYVESVWNWIRTAPYQSVLPGIDDPGLNPVPLPTATPNAAFGDFDLDGQVDIRVSDFQRETSSNGQTPISVQLTPLHPGFVVAQVMASVQLKGTTANRTTPISLENNGSGLWTGNVPASLQTNLSSYFYLDIKANGLTKRAVIKN